MSKKKCIEDILAKPFILSDTGVGHPGEDIYGEHLFHVNSFNRLQIEELKKLSNYLAFSYDWFSNSQIYTVPGVIKEIHYFRDIMKDKLSYLNRQQKPMFKTKKNDDNKKKIFENIYFTLHQIARKSRKSKYTINEPLRYLPIENMIDTISHLTEASIDYSYRFDQIKRSNKNNTDEQLVAYAFYRSLIENNPTTIVTNDSDIARIAIATKYHISKASHSLRNQIAHFKIEIYFSESRYHMVKVFDSSHTYHNQFCSFNYTRNEKSIHTHTIEYLKQSKLVL